MAQIGHMTCCIQIRNLLHPSKDQPKAQPPRQDICKPMDRCLQRALMVMSTSSLSMCTGAARKYLRGFESEIPRARLFATAGSPLNFPSCVALSWPLCGLTTADDMAARDHDKQPAKDGRLQVFAHSKRSGLLLVVDRAETKAVGLSLATESFEAKILQNRGFYRDCKSLVVSRVWPTSFTGLVSKVSRLLERGPTVHRKST